MSGMPNKPSGSNPRPGTSPAAGGMYKEYVPSLGDWQVAYANPGNKMVQLEDRYYNPVTGQKISGTEFRKNYLPELREQHWSNTPNKPIDTSALGAMGSTAPKSPAMQALQDHFREIEDRSIKYGPEVYYRGGSPVTSNSPIANSKLPGNLSRPYKPPIFHSSAMGSDGATYRNPWANRNQIPSAGNNRRTK